MTQTFWHDLRHTVRALIRVPRFTLVAVFTLALGIGATTAIFSVVNGVLLRPLPYPGSERIVGLWHGAPDLGYDQFGISAGVFHQYLTENQVYEAMGLYRSWEPNLTDEGQPERVPAVVSTAGLFDVLGVAPLMGRTFTEEEAREGGAAVVVVSYALWQRRFGGRQDILGQTLHVHGASREIIGVMPLGFDFGGPNRAAELWLPAYLNLENGDPGSFSWNAVARLRPDATPEAAVAQEEVLLQHVRERWAGEESLINFMDAGGFHPIVHSLQEEVVGDMERALWVLLGTVGFVLLIACANVANLSLVRAEGRQREMAVRVAIGATRGRLARAFFLESMVLAAAGGALGVAAAWAGTPLLLRMAPPELPRLDQVSMDGTVLAFALGATFLAALLFGAAPALRHDISGLLGVLRSAGRGGTEGRGRHYLRKTLVVAQTALATVLLVGAGLLAKSFWEVHRIDPGFDKEGILTFRLSLPGQEYPGAAEPAAFHQQLLERLRGLPGVASAGGISALPLAQSAAGTAYEIEDIPTPTGELPPMFWYKYASPGYFETMGISVVAGRGFRPSDHETELGNIVVNKALADRIWPGQDVLGKRIRPEDDTASIAWERIVGVVENTRDRGLREDPGDMIYHALVGPRADRGWSVTSMTYVVRSENPTGLIGGVLEVVRDMDPSLPLVGIQTMEEVVAGSIIRLTFTAIALCVASLLALILAAVGLYGVLSYVVSQRTQEIGVRMALGAQARQVLRMVVASGTRLAVLGLLLGLVGAGALTRLLRALLYGTEPLDPLTFAGMSVVLLGVGLVASYLPARRAACVDPAESIRRE